MKNSDDRDKKDDGLNTEEPRLTRDEIIAEIHRIRDEIKFYPALSDFKKHSRYDTEEIYRHFEWYNDAIKAAKAASTSTNEVADQPEDENEPRIKNTTSTARSDETVDSTSASRENNQSAESSECTREELLKEIIRFIEQPDKKASPIEFHRNSQCESADTYSYFDSWSEAFDAAMEHRSSGRSASESDSRRMITIRITDDGTPLRGAHIAVGNTDGSSRQTDEQGIVKIPILEAIDQVALEITHRRWVNKDLNTGISEDTHSYTVDISESEWQTDVPEEESFSESESEDEPSDVISTILRDMDRLDED